MNVVKIPVGEAPEVIAVPDNNWDEIRKLIGCQMLEPLTINCHGRQCTIFVDEYGGPRKLPMNPVATSLIKEDLTWSGRLSRNGLVGVAVVAADVDVTKDLDSFVIDRITLLNEGWMS